MGDMSQQVKEEQRRQRECQEATFKAREEMRKAQFEMEKIAEDRKHLIE
jgi:hypothetical protein